MSTASIVPDGGSVLVDSAPIIYVLERHALHRRFEPLFSDVERGRVRPVITPVTLAEVVAGPLRHGRDALAERYRLAITTDPWRLRPMDAEIAMLASRLRVRHRWKLPDAVQAATAIAEGCRAIVTHDRDFRRLTDVAVLDAW